MTNPGKSSLENAGRINAQVVVLGGGISGLTLTYRLYQRGIDVVLVEASDQLGGVIGTELVDEFLLEHGPNSTLSKPALSELFAELNLDSEVLYPADAAKFRFIVGGTPLTLRPVPVRLFGAATSPILSLAGKLRALLEPFIARSTSEDESVESFISRRLGTEFADGVVAPMLGGIWAADIGALSCRTALPALWRMEQQHGSLSLSALRRYTAQRSGHNKLRPKIATLRGGLSTLVDALVSRIPPERILRSTQATAVNYNRDGVTVTCTIDEEKTGCYSVPAEQKLRGTLEIHAAHCISELPAASTAKLLQPYAPELAARISDIPYAPVGVLHLGCSVQSTTHPLNGFGFLVPPRHKLATLGAIFSSALFPGRAPNGMHLLTCFTGGGRNPELADVIDPAIQNRVIAEVSNLLGLTETPKVLRSTYVRHAIPNYPLGHAETQQLVDSANANSPQFQVYGNWLRGISLGDRIEHAAALAAKLCESPFDQAQQAPAQLSKAIGS